MHKKGSSKLKYRFWAAWLAVAALLQPTAAFAADAQAPISNVEFLIDVSGSMAGSKIAGVQSAVKTLILGLPSTLKVEVVIFNDSINQIVPPTTDKQYAIQKISEIKVGRGTAVYDAISQSISAADPGTHVILLSDGEDTNSAHQLASLLKELDTTEIQLDAIGLQTSGNQAAILEKVTNATGGDYFQIDQVSLLLDAYTKAINKIIASPTPSASPSPSPSAKPSEAASPSKADVAATQDAYIQYALYALAISVAVIVFLILSLVRTAWRRRNIRFSRFASVARYDIRMVTNPFGQGFDASFLKKYIPARLNTYVADQLELIHSKVTSEQIFALFPFAWLIVAFLLNGIFHNPIVNGLVSTVITPLAIDRTWKFIHKRQQKEFDSELPELLNLLSSALRGGLSLQQGLEAYASENTGELARQIRRAIAEIHMGTSIDEALMKVANRMHNEDLKWTVTALSIQKTVGGSMATIINSVYETISSRAEIRREVRTLSAEGKLSAYVLIALPVGLFLYLVATKPDYAALLWTTPVGFAILGYIILSITIGWFWMKKIVDIKV